MGNESSRSNQNKPEDVSLGLGLIWRKIEQAKRYRRKLRRSSIVSTTELLFQDDIESAECSSSAGRTSQQAKVRALEKVPEEIGEEEEYCNEPKDDHVTELKGNKLCEEKIAAAELEHKIIEPPNETKLEVQVEEDHEMFMKKDDDQEVVTTISTEFKTPVLQDDHTEIAESLEDDDEEQPGRKFQRNTVDEPGSPSFRYYCNQTSDSFDNSSPKKENDLPRIMKDQLQYERSKSAESLLVCEKVDAKPKEKEKGKKLRVLKRAPTAVSNLFRIHNWHCSCNDPFSDGNQESPHLPIVARKVDIALIDSRSPLTIKLNLNKPSSM